MSFKRQTSTLSLFIFLVFVFTNINQAQEQQKQRINYYFNVTNNNNNNINNNNEDFSQYELNALAKFRPLVLQYLSAEYMKSDYYLINWLRAKNLNVVEARELLFQALEWRKSNGFDSARTGTEFEDFSDWDKIFKYNLDGVDKYGHPIIIAALGRWNPRQIILAGQADKYSRFIVRTLFELPSAKARELAAAHGRKNPIGQYVSVFDLAGFNPRLHLCLSCLPSYRNIVVAQQQYYPFATNRTLIINAPEAFNVLMKSLRPLLATNRRRSLEIFGYNKNEWQESLLETIETDQLPVQYGGIGPRKL